MLVVAGTSLKHLNPRVWDSSSPYYLSQLQAIMVSYSNFFQMPSQRKRAMDQGIRAYLGVPSHVKVYLDNGAFFFMGNTGHVPEDEYNEFVANAKPDWWPIPQDFIPVATLNVEQQLECFTKTMCANLAYQQGGCTPVIHISAYLHAYTSAVLKNPNLAAKSGIALGGIVPNLLRKSKAIPYQDILNALMHVREQFTGKHLHVFGIGGTATLHIAALLNIDSVDSSGWRNRAARGIIQLPGSGDRSVANLGSWRGRALSSDEWDRLAACPCPACRLHGLAGLQSGGSAGFCVRAAHNLWTLLEESQAIQAHLLDGSYVDWYQTHLDNTIYLPLINQLVATRGEKLQHLALTNPLVDKTPVMTY